MNKLKEFRKDIDGLRAIAVIAVITHFDKIKKFIK